MVCYLMYLLLGSINLTASAEELQSALNLARGSDDVTVTKTDEGLSATYLVVFHIQEGKKEFYDWTDKHFS